MNKEDYKKIIPGFTMGIFRYTIYHITEMIRFNKTQKDKYLFIGICNLIILNSLEKGIQFGMYEKFKLNDGNLISSVKASIISTTLYFPYNIVSLRNKIVKSYINIPKDIFYKWSFLEYSGRLYGSIIFLSSYNYLKDIETPIFIRATIANCFFWLLTYPTDRYKNILLSKNKNEKISIRQLYKGIEFPLIKSIPFSIIGFYVYEHMLTILNQNKF